VSGRPLRIAAFRTRAAFGRRAGGYLAVVLLLGLVGGLALGAVAAARRTQSSFPAYVASTNPADMDVLYRYLDPAIGDTTGYDAAQAARLARLAHVVHAATVVGFDANLELPANLHLHLRPGEQPPAVEGSPDGEFATQDKVTLLQGHLADPRRLDQVVMNAEAARVLGMHLGSTLPLAFDSDAQLFGPDCCTATNPPPVLRVDVHLVGIVAVRDTVVQDDTDALSSQIALLTPALTRRLDTCCATYTGAGLRLDGSPHDVAIVQGEIDKMTGTTTLDAQTLTPAADEATTERAIRPESIAIGVFGAIAGLAALLIAAQVLGRQLRRGAAERAVLRALGAGPLTVLAEAVLGLLGAVALGALVAVGVALVLSPVGPIGPVRPVYPTPGIAADWTVLGLGALAMVVVLTAGTAALAALTLPHRVAARRGADRPSGASRVAAATGLPVAAATGIRFALEPGRGANAVPVRSAILGAVLAVTIVTTTFTFGASLDTLVARPALYGWNWNYAVVGGFAGDEDLDQGEVAMLLDHDPAVTAWTGVSFAAARIDGQSVPVLGAVLGLGPKDAVGPALLSGHGIEGPGQIVVGPATAAALRVGVGATVGLDAGTGLRRLEVVGTATMPAIGNGGKHTQMGTGAWIADSVIPAALRNLQGSPVPGPQAVLVRVRPGDPDAVASLLRMGRALQASPDGVGGILGVLRPAEIVNYRTIGTAPALLGASLAAGAVVALGLTLVASVRRRRRDLALLKTMGCTRRQLAAVVAWQASVAVVIGVVVGITLGIAVGRALWDLFAHQIDAVPLPTVPAATLVLVAVGAVVLGNLVAAVPGRLAARTPTALLLRSE